MQAFVLADSGDATPEPSGCTPQIFTHKQMIGWRPFRLLPSIPAVYFRTADASSHFIAAQQAVGHHGTFSGHFKFLNNARSTSTATASGNSAKPRSKTFDEYRKSLGLRTQDDYMRLDRANCAGNYVPTPVVISRGEGVFAWDIDGNRYFDFVAGISVR